MSLSIADRTSAEEDLVRRIREHLPTLQARLRSRQITLLATTLKLDDRGYEQSCARAQVAEDLAPLMILCLGIIDAVPRFQERQAALKRQFDQFAELYFRLTDKAERTGLIVEFLHASAEGAQASPADLNAVSRFLGFDVLAERNAAARQDCSVCVELGLLVIDSAIKLLLQDRGETRRGRCSEVMLSEYYLDLFLVDHAIHGPRWQERLPALSALCTLYASLRASCLLDLADPEIMRSAIGLAEMTEIHPWLQIRAIEISLILDEDAGFSLLARRLHTTAQRPPKTDFLVREHCVMLLSLYRCDGDGLELLRALIEAGAPSEHVRIGVCNALHEFAPIGGVELCRAMTSAAVDRPEPSARVRAHASLTLIALISETTLLDRYLESLLLLKEVLESEDSALVLGVTCSALQKAAQRLSRATNKRWIQLLAEHLTRPLTTILVDPTRTPGTAERVAQCLEVFAREASAPRQMWTQRLTELALSIPPGRARTMSMARLHAGLPPMDPPQHFLGRTLADITSDDWGLRVRLDRTTLHIARGDHFKRRAWRILHELLHPAPNKRQGYTHTIGRDLSGQLRAPSGRLHEITPTVVPGERLHVERESGWGRHLPLVDDIVALPLLRRADVHIYSSHGVTTLTPSSSLLVRIWSRLRLAFAYRRLADLRTLSLSADLEDERRRYVDTLRQRFGVSVLFTPYLRGLPGTSPQRPCSPHVRSLLPAPQDAQPAPPDNAQPVEPSQATAGFVAMPNLWDSLTDVFGERVSYFMSLAENSHRALALFAALLLGWVLVGAFLKRQRIRRARAAIPLSIGGWGTRGKSGTERLKAGLFTGLGFHVFSKTTGCEAMMIHSRGGDQPEEIFVFRPFDKATIWEQRDMLELAASLGTEVFLWECMALNPIYVRLLEHSWMGDDITTLTNAYPDHEDIQGPSGYDVAQVIADFIPADAVLVTSETHFRAMLAERCRELKTRIHDVDEFAGELIAEDLLGLFPYSEHPTNVALVQTLAQTMEIDPDLAVYTMANNVVPDLGMLKVFRPVQVLGRTLTFINGMSANERTGFMNNWQRTKCVDIDSTRDPKSYVVTVLNNRADRISRSEVFARIIVNDIDADRHVLIGTNLKGLIRYVDDALRSMTDAFDLVRANEINGDLHEERPRARLAHLMHRLRIPEVGADPVLDRIAGYARGVKRTLSGTTELHRQLSACLASPDRSTSAAANERALRANTALRGALDAALVPLPEAAESRGEVTQEVFEDAPPDCVYASLIDLLTELLTRTALEEELAQVLRRPTKSAAGRLRSTVAQTYRELFHRKLCVVSDPDATGDQIIAYTARTCPPGAHVTIMGAQNIKGTGLDLAYRWLALGRVSEALRKLSSNRPTQRDAGFDELEGFEDYGLVDAGLAVLELDALRGSFADDREETRLERVAAKVKERFRSRATMLSQTSSRSIGSYVIDWIEGWLDFIDSVRRRRESDWIKRELIAQRISHGRAAAEMRRICARQKGGWLRKWTGQWGSRGSR